MSSRRVALVSDIHGNAVGLDAVLSDVRRRRIAEIVCLGDIAAGGPEPREAIDRLRGLGYPVVRGNADEWLLDAMPDEPESEDFQRLKTIVEWTTRRASANPAAACP